MKKLVLIIFLMMMLLAVGCNSQEIVSNELVSNNKEEEQTKENIQVDLSITEEYDSKKGLIFYGSTNLPSNMKLFLEISNSNGFTTQNTVIIQNGMFSSDWYKEKPGDYEVLVTSPSPIDQARDVRYIIGEKGNQLVGDYVLQDSNEKRIKTLISVSFQDKQEEQPFTYDPNSIEKTQDTIQEKSVDEDDVYKYIMYEFDILTDYGENYIPEVHDQIVLEKASKHFGIPLKEVDKIFMDRAMQLP